MGESVAPYGTGLSAPSFGMCPTTKPWDNEREIMPLLAQHKLSAFDEAAGCERAHRTHRDTTRRTRAAT